MKVDINEIYKLQARRKQINDSPIQEIEWYNGDTLIKVDPDLLEKWKFIGLSNIDFITTEFYKEN